MFENYLLEFAPSSDIDIKYDNLLDNCLLKLDTYCKETGFDKKLEIKLRKLVSKATLSSINETEKGYCMKFINPESDVLDIFTETNLYKKKELSTAFQIQWGYPPNAMMYGNPYYHNLMMVIIFAISRHKPELGKQALTLILFKIWNGRMRQFIKYCDADTMSYVISNMMNNKFLAKKFNSPLEMITDHFAPTLYTKYSPVILRGSNDSKKLFNQCWNRLRQLFVSTTVTDLNTMETNYSSGLAPKYYKAKIKGLKVSSTRISQDGEDYDISDNMSSNTMDQRIETITNFIVMNNFPEYSKEFLEFVKSKVKIIRENYLNEVIKGIHDINYTDEIHDILELFFKRILNMQKAEICQPGFFVVVKKKIISSKHTPDITALKFLADKLLTQIFRDKIPDAAKFETTSGTNKSQFRNILLYAIAYNIKRSLCSGTTE